MNKKIILIIVMLVALAALGLIVILLSREESKAEHSESETPLIDYIYFTGNMNDIESVVIRNIYGEYTVKGGENPAVEGYEELPVSVFYFLNILDVSSALVSYGIVTDSADDLSVFGLSPAQAQLTIKPKNKTEITLLIGYSAPDRNMYVKLSDSPQVFLASFFDVSIFHASLFSLIDTAVTPPLIYDQNDVPVFERIILAGEAREEIIITKTDISVNSTGLYFSPFRIASPVRAAVAVEHSQMLESLFGIYADRFTAVLSSDAALRRNELESYGLLRPWSVIEITVNSINHRVLFSKPDDNGVSYVYREGTPVVYEAYVYNFQWFEISYFDLMDKMVLLPFIDSVASIEIKTQQRTVSFTLTGTENNLSVRSNGSSIDTGNFRTFYQNLVAARYDEYNDADTALSSPFLEIVYNYRGGTGNPDTVSFYETAARRVLTSLNRGRAHFTLSAYTDQLLADLDHVLAGVRIRSFL